MGESWNRSDIHNGEFKSCARNVGVGMNSSAAVNRPSIRLNASFIYRTGITSSISIHFFPEQRMELLQA